MKLKKITLLVLLGCVGSHSVCYTENTYLQPYTDIVENGNYGDYSSTEVERLSAFLDCKAQASQEYQRRLDEFNKAVRAYYIKKTAKLGVACATCYLGYRVLRLGLYMLTNQDIVESACKNLGVCDTIRFCIIAESLES